MGLFGKSKTTTSLVCKICDMKFSDPERTVRHMVRAYGQSTWKTTKKEKDWHWQI